MNTKMNTNKVKSGIGDLPDTMIWEITKHLDPKTIISLLPISFHPPGVARDAMFALQAELRHSNVMIDYLREEMIERSEEMEEMEENMVRMLIDVEEKDEKMEEMEENMIRMLIDVEKRAEERERQDS